MLFTALAVLHTWPMAAAPGVWSRNDSPDYVLHEWIMAWVAHQIVTNPLHLFDANIFYPDRYTLAYSDHLILQSLMGAPLAWSGGSPVLVHNIVLMAGFALTGWTTALVVGSWTGSRTAGVLSGSLMAFNSFTLTRLAQMQDLHLEFFAPALFALDRFIVSAQTKDALKLAGWFVLQALTGTYVMLFTAISLVVAALARASEFAGQRFRAIAPRALLAAAVATVVLAPVLIPYVIASREVGLSRSLQETANYVAEWTDYLAAAGRLHFGWWSSRFWSGDGLFPGVVAVLLTIVALVRGVAFTDRRARMVLAIGVGGAGAVVRAVVSALQLALSSVPAADHDSRRRPVRPDRPGRRGDHGRLRAGVARQPVSGSCHGDGRCAAGRRRQRRSVARAFRLRPL